MRRGTISCPGWVHIGVNHGAITQISEDLSAMPYRPPVFETLARSTSLTCLAADQGSSNAGRPGGCTATRFRLGFEPLPAASPCASHRHR